MSDAAERRERWAKRYDDVRHANPPGSYAWVEHGGDEAALREWIGGDLPLRFVGGAPGLRAVAIDSLRGEIVVR